MKPFLRSLSLWVPPALVIAVWVAVFTRVPLPGAAPVWAYLLIFTASLVTFLISGVCVVVRYAEPWAWMALIVNLFGLLFNGIGIAMGLAGAYS